MPEQAALGARKARRNRAGAPTRVLTLFEHYRSRLRRFLLDRSVSAHSANDLAQEVYLRLLRFPPQEIVQQPQAYLYRVATNVVNDFNLRTKKDCVTFDSNVVDELAEHTVNVWVDDPEEQLCAEQELKALLCDLPPAHLAALLLAKRDGLSYEAIAERLGVTVHTVKKYIVRAIAHCRATLRETGRT
jgi:RNA polymerase sigma factor (sigma-70 family)